MRSTLFFLVLSLLVCLPEVDAQHYRTAGGVRVGQGLGFTFKQKVLDKTAIEAILLTSVGNQETGLVLLAEQHQKLLFKRFTFYPGIGVHKTWNADVPDAFSETSDPAGVSGIIGVEMTVGRFNIGWDYLAQLNLWGDARFFQSNTAVSLRYVFWERKRKKANLKFWEWGKKDKKKKKRNWRFWEK